MEPSVLMIRLLEACNAGCFMCNCAFSNDTYRFSLEDAERLVLKLKKSDIKLIRYTGGEPLLLDEIVPITKLFSNKGYLTSMITNGWYLPEKANSLIEAGLNQVIISLDGHNSRTHDKYRKLDGLFESIINGIKAVKDKGNCSVRVNTIVGHHNIEHLVDMYKLLVSLNVDAWSLIPLKTSDGVNKYADKEKTKKLYETFSNAINVEQRPTLLGYSKKWLGRDDNEIENFISSQSTMTPKPKCLLVDKVRYYIPKSELVYTCNAIPHKIQGKELGEPIHDDVFTSQGLVETRNLLREQKEFKCNSCEPINTYFGELTDISKDRLLSEW